MSDDHMGDISQAALDCSDEELAHDQRILRELIAKSSNIVFFGGAGTSTESGIPDFRGKDGIFNKENIDPDLPYRPEKMLSHWYLMEHTADFYTYTSGDLKYMEAQPNPLHWKLAELEREGKLSAIITQNIDGLHQKAGSRNVFELHGSVYRYYCLDCGKVFGPEIFGSDPRKRHPGEPYPTDSRFADDGIPYCDRCGGMIRPDVVLYQEGLDEEVLASAMEAVTRADMLIVGGSSLVVYPAAGLTDRFTGDSLVIVNQLPTTRDKYADLVSRVPIGKLFDW